MICLIALFAFGVLGIFSAKYRTYFREALNCVFRRATLRKCDTGFDKKMKAKIVGRLMDKNPKLAGSVFRHFEAISWFFTILLFVSMFYSAQGIYYYAKFGNCNGEQGGFCIFNAVSGTKETIALSDMPLDRYPAAGPKNAAVQVVEFGCFQCPYTRAAEPAVRHVLEKYPNDVRMTFVYAPVPHHYNALRAAEAAVCAAGQGKFSAYRTLLFENQESFGNTIPPEQAVAVFENLAAQAGLNQAEFESCITSDSAVAEVQKSLDYATRLGITKTPTFYVNGKKLSGVISEKDIEQALAAARKAREDGE